LEELQAIFEYLQEQNLVCISCKSIYR